MSYQGLFPIPLWHFNLNLDNIEIEEIKNYCIQLKNKTPGRLYTNVGGWQSEDIIKRNITNTPLYIVFCKIVPILQECMQDLGSSHYLHVDNAWVNINDKTNWNRPHTHDGSLLSGVFYLTDNNSDIEFIKDPDINTYFQENIFSKRDTELSFRSFRYTPIKGELYIFPSWLRHSVHPSESNSERVSISFNTYIKI
jgi:uncharacterized protein (TIGR02466 family)